jgi:hypothetical protein
MLGLCMHSSALQYVQALSAPTGVTPKRAEPHNHQRNAIPHQWVQELQSQALHSYMHGVHQGSCKSHTACSMNATMPSMLGLHSALHSALQPADGGTHAWHACSQCSSLLAVASRRTMKAMAHGDRTSKLFTSQKCRRPRGELLPPVATHGGTHAPRMGCVACPPRTSAAAKASHQPLTRMRGKHPPPHTPANLYPAAAMHSCRDHNRHCAASALALLLVLLGSSSREALDRMGRRKHAVLGTLGHLGSVADVV